MENNNSKRRILYLDILNLISIIAVIAMHHNGIVHGSPNSMAWNTSLIVDCLCYFAVPVFCMISGATLMNYRTKYDTKTFFKKRIEKVFVPFVFWAIIMFGWRIWIVKDLKINGILDFVQAFFQSREEPTYYFMFVIMGVYMLMPLLSLLNEEKHRKTLWLTIILYFIINSFLVPILRLFKIEWDMHASILIGDYVIFAILGYLLSTEDIDKRYRILVYCGSIIGLIYRYLYTFILSKSTGEVNKLTWGYNTWNSILLAISVFLIIKGIFKNDEAINNRIKKTISILSSCSFGIYLVHKIVLYYEIHLLSLNEYSWQWRTIGVISTYLISFGIVYILKKIPVVKKVVP